MPCPPWFKLAFLCQATWKHGERVLCLVCAYVCIWLHPAYAVPFAAYGSVFLTCVAPLQNKQRWGKTAPNSLSTHSFLQTLHENRWLWHYQQSQLVSHACSGGDRKRSTGPFYPHHRNDEGFSSIPVSIFCSVSYIVSNISYYNLIHKHIPTFCKSSDPKHLMLIYVYHYKQKVITLILTEM